MLATLRARRPQFVIRAIALAGFLFAILAGFIGTPVGNRNFSIVFVWIVWWALLVRPQSLAQAGRDRSDGRGHGNDHAYAAVVRDVEPRSRRAASQ